MYLGIPQLIYIGLTLMGIGSIISKHGQPRIGRYNVWSSLISTSVILLLLYAGGFFSK